MSMRGGLLIICFLLLISVGFGARTTSSSGVQGILQNILNTIVEAFKANPIYCLIAFGAGVWPIGWFAHQMVFGY